MIWETLHQDALSTVNLKPIISVSETTSHSRNSTSILLLFSALMAPVTKALIPKGFQSVKLGLTEGLVGGAIKAAVSRALN